MSDIFDEWEIPSLTAHVISSTCRDHLTQYYGIKTPCKNRDVRKNRTQPHYTRVFGGRRNLPNIKIKYEIEK